MTIQQDWHDNLRVRYDSPVGETSTEPPPPERSAPQAHTDHALNEAAKAVNEALEQVVAAVEWLASVSGGQVKNREAPHYVNLLREEIAEAKRVRQ
jgi:hypothetical protein